MRYAVIVAAGNSARYGRDKLDEPLMGKTVLQHSVDVFRSLADMVVVVGRHVDGTTFAEGGEMRFESVMNGLRCIPSDGVVAVHDGARPFVSRQLAERLYAEAEKFGSAVPALAVTDTLYSKFTAVDRDGYFVVQTPQVFATAALKEAYSQAVGSDASFTDDSSVFAAAKGSVHFVEGQRNNIKLTYDGDLPDFRIGTGFDVHPFGEGRGVTLGGVKIPFDKQLKGHSDADVLCHALCDAILSAVGNRDIGHQFPDTDPTYEGIDSTLLLERCVAMALEGGFELVNVSATVICQAPKIAPYIDAMSQRLAQICRVAPSCVAISATTTEKLGALGNGDGIAAEAVALLRKFRSWE